MRKIAIIAALVALSTPVLAQQKPDIPPTPFQGGKFQIHTSDGFSLLLNSQTAEVWRLVWVRLKSPNCEAKKGEVAVPGECRYWYFERIPVDGISK